MEKKAGAQVQKGHGESGKPAEEKAWVELEKWICK